MIIPNLYIYITKEITSKNSYMIEEPDARIDSNAYFNYLFEDMQVLTLLDSKYTRYTDWSKPLFYREYKHDFTDYKLNGIYLPYDDSQSFDIPYEYYSKAYIHPTFSTKDVKPLPQSIMFSLDSYGRLHIKHTSLLAFIEVMDKKIPIKAGIDLESNVDFTLENQQNLCEQYLAPYILLNNSLPTNPINVFAPVGSYAEELLLTAPPIYLEYLMKDILPVGQALSKNFSTLKFSLNGWIFPDGSYLVFKNATLYHNLFLKYLTKISIEYADDYWVKLNEIDKNKPISALYNKENLTHSQRLVLNRFKTKYNIEEFNIGIK